MASSSTVDSTQTSNLKCYCGLPAPIRVSLASDNIGRKFVGCVNYKVRPCNFFCWMDGPTCKRGIEFGKVVNKKIAELKELNHQLAEANSYLQRKNEETNEKLTEMEKKNEVLKKLLEEAEHRNEALLKKYNKDGQRKIRIAVIIIGVLAVWMLLFNYDIEGMENKRLMLS